MKPPQLLRRWVEGLLPSVLLAVGLFVQALQPPLLEEIQLKVFDTFQRFRPRLHEPAPVLIVDLDNESLKRIGQWPWPRTDIARMVRRLHELGASAIAFDIVFAEPDRTSPAHILPLLPPGVSSAQLQAAASSEWPDHDRELAKAFEEAVVVTGFSFTEEPGGRQPALKAGWAHAGDDPRQFIAGFPGAVANLPLLEAAAKGNGHFNMLADRDGILRRVPLFLKSSDHLYPSLVAETLRVAQGATTYLVKCSGGSGESGWGAHTGMISVKIGEFVVPTDAQGRLWLYDTGHVPSRFIPAWRLLEGGVSPEEINGKVILIGTSAAGLKDLRATPLHPVTAGVEIHAQLAEQVIQGIFLYRPDWAPGAEFLFLLLGGLGLMWGLPRVGAAWCALLGSATLAAVVAGSGWLFMTRRWLLDPFFPSLVAAGLYTVSSLIHFLRTEAEKRQVRQAFGRYLSPELVKRLVEHPEQLKLGGERKIMTLLFMDIRHFTTLSERLDAEGLTRFVNQFFTPMTEVILQNGGTIDKYIGDCIMAFWNAPLDDPHHAQHACLAALGMRRVLADWNKTPTPEAPADAAAGSPLSIGIGINTGECCVGNLGSKQRFDYSVLGDAVNLASRLEGQSKTYGVDIVIGEATEAEGSECATLELDLVTVKGKTQPVRIYALLGDSAMRASAEFQDLQVRHRAMLAAYRAQRWEEALRCVEECLVKGIPQVQLRALYALYARRIEGYKADPPAADWNGVFVAASK